MFPFGFFVYYSGPIIFKMMYVITWKQWVDLILSTLNRIPTRGQSQKGSHVYFLLIVAMVLPLWCQVIMVASEQHLYQTVVLPRKLASGSIHDYLFCYYPLVGILFEVLRINWKIINFWVKIALRLLISS